MKILVVDDDAIVIKSCKRILEAEGLEVSTVPSADEALEMIKKYEFDLLLIDVKMPRHDGMFLMREIMKVIPDMPIIVMSGKPYNVKMDALLADADEFLEANLGGSALASRVKRWMNRLEAAPDVFLPQREEDILPLDEVKCRYARHVVQLVGNNISLAAQKLGVHRQTISAAMATEDVEKDTADDGPELMKPITTFTGSETNDRR